MRCFRKFSAVIFASAGLVACNAPPEPADVAPPEPRVVRPWAVDDGAPDRFMPNSAADRSERVNHDLGSAPLPDPVAPRRR